jgi:hypothetical protein
MLTKRSSHVNVDNRSALIVGRIGTKIHVKLNFDGNMARSSNLYNYSKIFCKVESARNVVCMFKSFQAAITCAAPSVITSSAGYASAVTQIYTTDGGI